MFNEEIAKGTRCVINTKNFQIRAYRVYEDSQFKGFPSFLNGVEIKGTNEDAYEEYFLAVDFAFFDFAGEFKVTF